MSTFLAWYQIVMWFIEDVCLILIVVYLWIVAMVIQDVGSSMDGIKSYFNPLDLTHE